MGLITETVVREETKGEDNILRERHDNVLLFRMFSYFTDNLCYEKSEGYMRQFLSLLQSISRHERRFSGICGINVARQ